MDLIAQFPSLLMGKASYILPFLFVLTIVIFIHELGHFLVARWFGIKIDAFSIGFGGEIAGFNDRHGTRWKLCWIPLGGYVKFRGDETAASQPVSAETLASVPAAERAHLFHAKPVGQRAAVVAAGPIANFLLAIVVFAGLFMTVGRAVIEPRIETVIAGSAAEAAGLVSGDVIVALDGHRVETFSEIQRIVATSNGRPLAMTVRRDGQEVSLIATPRQTESAAGRQRSYVLGIQAASGRGGQGVEYRVYDPVSALGLGVRETWFLIDRTLVFVRDLIVGQGNVDELGGPIRIAEVSGQAAAISFVALLSLMAVLSVSIGLLNLFPIPILDGGHLVFYAIEAARGRPLSERTQEIGFRVGLGLVLTLMVVATWNDIARLVGS